MADKNLDTYINDQLKAFQNLERIFSKDIPNIDLYMDQVTTFMDEHLGLLKRSPDDKILTKTMINNYSKYGLLPPTKKKKYTNDHIILMLFIYSLKPILSIDDIKSLLIPIQEMFMDETLDPPEGFPSLKTFYDTIIEAEATHFSVFEDRSKETASIAKNMFDHITDDQQRKLLTLFTTSYLFIIQSSAQKHIITSLIDDYLKDTSNTSKNNKH